MEQHRNYAIAGIHATKLAQTPHNFAVPSEPVTLFRLSLLAGSAGSRKGTSSVRLCRIRAPDLVDCEEYTHTVCKILRISRLFLVQTADSKGVSLERNVLLSGHHGD
jgi:hypothetical protein